MPNMMTKRISEELKITPYHVDFVRYYGLAKSLNERNIGKYPRSFKCGDQLMDVVTIYDTVWRRYAGFANMLEDLWYGKTKETCTTQQVCPTRLDCSDVTWFYLFIVHRITGSGASFESDHGYRNTILKPIYNAGLCTIEQMVEFIKRYQAPFFTSIGNQIPPFNKPTGCYDKGGREFLCEHAPKLAQDLYNYLKSNNRLHEQRTTVDWVLDWLTSHGFKRYKFVMTAMVMDIAEYFPSLVDRSSHCYYGKNCFEALDLMFVPGKGRRDKKFYDYCMVQLCQQLGNFPYNMEDVCCDYIRYVENYIPQEYLDKGLHYLKNTSLIHSHPGRKTYAA
jgi:hypothetical protein